MSRRRHCPNDEIGEHTYRELVKCSYSHDEETCPSCEALSDQLDKLAADCVYRYGCEKICKLDPPRYHHGQPEAFRVKVRKAGT